MVVDTANNLLAIGYIRMKLPSIYYTHVYTSKVTRAVHFCGLSGLKLLSEDHIINSRVD